VSEEGEASRRPGAHSVGGFKLVVTVSMLRGQSNECLGAVTEVYPYPELRAEDLRGKDINARSVMSLRLAKRVGLLGGAMYKLLAKIEGRLGDG